MIQFLRFRVSKFIQFNLILSASLLVSLAQAGGATPPPQPPAQRFPATEPGFDIGSELPSSFEPSGLAWHSRLQQLVAVGDNGVLLLLNSVGVIQKRWTIAGNWEGVAVAEANSPFVYLINENTGKISEFDIVNGVMTARVFDLKTAIAAPGVAPLSNADKDAFVSGDDSTGFEALTFVNIENDSEGGVFYAGSQENGSIYKFRLSLSRGSEVTYLGKMKPSADKDLAGLSFDQLHQTIIALWDSENKIRVLDLNGRILSEWRTPSNTKGEEGLATDGQSMYIAEDDKSLRGIRRFDNLSFGSK